MASPPKAKARKGKEQTREIDVEGANDFRSVYCRAVGRGQQLTSSNALSKYFSVAYVCTP
jgi:hypothetical protein